MAKESAPSVGQAMNSAVSAILRWSTRADVQRSLRRADTPMSSTDVWLLDHIAAEGPMRMSVLAEWQSVDRSTMTTQVRRLEDSGLVTRTADPADSRAILVEASESGRATVADAADAASVVFDGLVTDWSRRDRDELSRLLTKFAAGLAPSD